MHHFILKISEYVVHLHVDDDDDDTLQALNEARDYGVKLGGTYSALKHKPHVSSAEYHLHIQDKGTEIAALNFSGSAHDGWHGVQLPNTVVQGIRNRFPKCKIPPNGFIEAASLATQFDFTLLLEGVLDED